MQLKMGNAPDRSVTVQLDWPRQTYLPHHQRNVCSAWAHSSAFETYHPLGVNRSQQTCGCLPSHTHTRSHGHGHSKLIQTPCHAGTCAITHIALAGHFYYSYQTQARRSGCKSMAPPPLVPLQFYTNSRYVFASMAKKQNAQRPGSCGSKVILASCIG